MPGMHVKRLVKMVSMPARLQVDELVDEWGGVAGRRCWLVHGERGRGGKRGVSGVGKAGVRRGGAMGRLKG